MFLMQKAMLRVCYALIPLVLASIYLFGWRSLVLIGIVFAFGIATEAIFAFRQRKPLTSAVFVTCLIFSLSLPPTLPFWMAIIGIVVGVAIGKMAFGGFGQNVFNPAMVGRCFLYITFPIEMTNTWTEPMWGGMGGFASWSTPADAITQATPLLALQKGVAISLQKLFLGNTPGSFGETSALLIFLGGAYIIYKKAAPWRLALSCLLGGMILSGILRGTGFSNIPSPIYTLLSGSFLFGTAFVVTEPISGAKTKAGQWVYGFMIGGLTIVLRGFSNFSEGIMFSVLIMNAFVPILDQIVRKIQSSKRGSQ
ncbi:MAG: RnfABCDGE type electron transport complex subunit D [Deltaproteobacteria bacterium]|nr:MAG: RnfABCDGE type electron transport complex subunit D [Deltaproteobacteria bacterium]